MKVLLLLAVILSAGLCKAADAQTPAAGSSTNTSIYASDLQTITQKCLAPEASVSVPDCMQQNLNAAKAMDDSMNAAGLSSADKQQIIETCSFKTLDAGLEKGLNALIELQKECIIKNIPKSTKMHFSLTLPGTGSNNQNPAASQQQSTAPSEGQEVGSSAYTTRSTCVLDNKTDLANGSAINNINLIGVRRELLAPKEASDIYGHRLGRRYIVYQVSVTDLSKDYQYVVHDITVNLKDVFAIENTPQVCQSLSDDQQKAACIASSQCQGLSDEKLATCIANSQCQGPKNDHNAACLASSRRLELLRGIPEKGQDYDPRNLSLHIMTGLGSVAGGVSGLTAFSDVMGSAVSVFNGAFLQAFVGILPDHTGTQLNRLSDQAFTSNSLVDKLHTKDFAIFIPQALVLRSAHQSQFWSSPRDRLNTIPLDQVDVCVDGSLVTEVSITPDPAISIDAGFPVVTNSLTTGINIAPGTPISIQDSASDATIYYTDVAGTTPSASSTKYAGPITYKLTDGTKIVRAIAISPNKAQSNIVGQTYTIQKMPLITVTAASAAGASPTLTLTAADPTNDTVYYTTDGKTTPVAPAGTTPPTSPTTIYTGATPLTVDPSGTTTIYALEVPTGGSGSTSTTPVAKYTYTAK